MKIKIIKKKNSVGEEENLSQSSSFWNVNTWPETENYVSPEIFITNLQGLFQEPLLILNKVDLLSKY
jgi:hypothetical protein